MVTYELQFKTNVSSHWKTQDVFKSYTEACHVARKTVMLELDNLKKREHIKILRIIESHDGLREEMKTFLVKC
jgi:hypothetical protein